MIPPFYERTEMTDLESQEEDTPPRILFYKSNILLRVSRHPDPYDCGYKKFQIDTSKPRKWDGVGVMKDKE